MTDNTAKIRSKGLDATGVTEDIARSMYHNLGGHYVAIVELKVSSHSEDTDGKRSVDLILTQVEPALDDDMAEHLRELTRTLYFNRAKGQQQLAIDEELDNEPTVEGVLAAGAKHRPHPYVSGGLSEDGERAICDVCGLLEAAGVHSTQDVLTADDEDEDQNDYGPEAPHDPADFETEPNDEDEDEPSNVHTIVSPFATTP